MRSGALTEALCDTLGTASESAATARCLSLIVVLWGYELWGGGGGARVWWAVRAEEARTGIRRLWLEAGSATGPLHAVGHDVQLAPGTSVSPSNNADTPVRSGGLNYTQCASHLGTHHGAA